MQSSLEEYIEDLIKRYQAHYNVEVNKSIAGKNLDIYAISVIEHFRHILTKKIKIDHYQEKEIILVKGIDKLIDLEEAKEFAQFLIKASKELINPSLDIMSHTINGLIISSHGFSKEAINTAKNFRYGRTFFLGIKGWLDIRLLLIDLKNNCINCNAKGNEIYDVYDFQKRKEEIN